MDGLATQEGRAGGLSWQLARRPPDPRLAGLVTDLCGYVESSDLPVHRRQPPVAAVPVILGLGPTIEVSGTRFTSFVAGMHDVSAHTEFTGDQRGVEILLTPVGAYRLLGLPLDEFANRTVDLPLLDALADRAAAAPDWATRLDLVEAALLRLAADGPEPDPATAWAWGVMRRRRGNVSVGALAAEIGWSRRHFAARFRQQIGLAPKVVARVLRFERAAGLISNGVAAAQAAAICGYADQSHLVREFRALAGCTPTAYLAELDAEQVTFVQDAEAVPA